MIIRIFKLCMVAVFWLLIASALTGCVYQRWAEKRDAELYPAPGELFPVDGSLMHIHCIGEGSPSVVIEQGAGSISVSWNNIQLSMAEVTRTCTYDRAGLGYSEPISYSRSAVEVADALGTLLDKAGITDDLILIGWSAGGVYARQFHYLNPDRVKGMIFVDSSHEQQGTKMPEEPIVNEFTIIIMNILAKSGLLRASGLIKKQTELLTSSETDHERLTALYSQSHAFSGFINDMNGFTQDIKTLPPPKSLNDLPIVVITRARPLEGSSESKNLENLNSAKDIRQKWYELQEEILKLSSNSQQIFARKSGHTDIHVQEPELIVDAATRMINSIRDQARN